MTQEYGIGYVTKKARSVEAAPPTVEKAAQGPNEDIQKAAKAAIGRIKGEK